MIVKKMLGHQSLLSFCHPYAYQEVNNPRQLQSETVERISPLQAYYGANSVSVYYVTGLNFSCVAGLKIYLTYVSTTVHLTFHMSYNYYSLVKQHIKNGKSEKCVALFLRITVNRIYFVGIAFQGFSRFNKNPRKRICEIGKPRFHQFSV